MKEEEKEAWKEIEREGGVYGSASHRPISPRKDASQRMKKSLHRPRYPTLVYHLKSRLLLKSHPRCPLTNLDLDLILTPNSHLKVPRSKPSRLHCPGSRGLTTYTPSSLSLFSSSFGLPFTDPRSHIQPRSEAQSRTLRPMTLKSVLKSQPAANNTPNKDKTCHYSEGTSTLLEEKIREGCEFMRSWLESPEKSKEDPNVEGEQREKKVRERVSGGKIRILVFTDPQPRLRRDRLL